jgi:hypothetical protein
MNSQLMETRKIMSKVLVLALVLATVALMLVPLLFLVV